MKMFRIEDADAQLLIEALRVQAKATRQLADRLDGYAIAFEKELRQAEQTENIERIKLGPVGERVAREEVVIPLPARKEGGYSESGHQ